MASLRIARLTAIIMFMCLTGLFAPALGQQCRLLAVSGGGDYGAWQAGVVKGLVAAQSAEQVKWDVVTGISSGSMVAASVAKFRVGQELKAANWTVQQVTTITAGQMIKPWSKDKQPTSMLDSSPLVETINSRLSGVADVGSGRPFNRMLSVYATEMTDPKYSDNLLASIRLAFASIRKTLYFGAFDTYKLMQLAGGFLTGKTTAPFEFTDALPEADILTGVAASAAIPIMFKPVTYRGKTLTDGGTGIGPAGNMQVINILGGLKRCGQITTTASEMWVDAVLAPLDPEGYNGSMNEAFNEEVAAARKEYPGVRIREIRSSPDLVAKHIKDNTEQLCSANNNALQKATGPLAAKLCKASLAKTNIPLGFNPPFMKEMAEIGQADGQAAANSPASQQLVAEDSWSESILK